MALQPRANYSLALAGIPLVRTIRVQSQGGHTLSNAHVDLTLTPIALPAASASLQVEGEILPGAAVFLEGAGLSPLIEPLANGRELTHAQLTVHVTTTDGAETSITAGVDIEPYNEFRNVPELYGSLAPFVQPNANALTAILRGASQLLARKTNDSSLQGYQVGPPRAHQIAGAIYEAIRAYGLSYINPPASFENTGQKIRTTQQVLDIRMGTCVDFEYVTTIGETSLAVEGPMSLDRLTDVIVRVCGYSRIGQTKRAMIAEILRRSFVVTTEGGIFLWPRTVDPATWRAVRRTANAGDRTIQDVSVHEVAAAMSQIVTEAMSATREDLHRETLEMLNFVRLTDATRARLDLGLDYAVSTNRIAERDGTYYPAG